MAGYDAQVAPRAPRPEWGRPTLGRVAVLLAGCAGIGGLLSPLAAWLWVVLSNPPEAPLAAHGGIFLGEQALNQQSGVTLWFLVLGAGFGTAAGVVVGWLGQRFGWLTVVGVLVLCGVGTVFSRYLGVHVFGSDPRSEAAHASVGDPIRLDVSLDTWVAYLGWPVGGLAGALAAIAGWSRSSRPPQMPGSSSILE